MGDSIDDYYRDEQERVLAQQRASADANAANADGVPPPSGSPDPSAPGDATAPPPASLAQAQREHAQQQRGMYCLGCGHDLTGLPAGQCPQCGRRFDPHNPGTYTVHPPQEATWLETHERVPAACWLVGLYVLGLILGSLIARYVFAGPWMVTVLYPFWMGVMLWQVLRLVKNERLHGLAFNVLVAVTAGAALGGVAVGLLALLAPVGILGSFMVLAGMCVGGFVGLVREYAELTEVSG